MQSHGVMILTFLFKHSNKYMKSRGEEDGCSKFSITGILKD